MNKCKLSTIIPRSKTNQNQHLWSQWTLLTHCREKMSYKNAVCGNLHIGTRTWLELRASVVLRIRTLQWSIILCASSRSRSKMCHGNQMKISSRIFWCAVLFPIFSIIFVFILVTLFSIMTTTCFKIRQKSSQPQFRALQQPPCGCLAEWLRRRTWKHSCDPLGNSFVGSNPAAVAEWFCFYTEKVTDRYVL